MHFNQSIRPKEPYETSGIIQRLTFPLNLPQLQFLHEIGQFRDFPNPNPPSPPYNWQAEANREHKDLYWLSKLCFAWPYWKLYNKFNKEAMMWIKTHSSLQLRSSECNPGLFLNVMYSSAQRTQKNIVEAYTTQLLGGVGGGEGIKAKSFTILP